MSIFRYIKYKKEFIIGFIAKTVEVIFELFLPIFMAILMKEGLKNGNTNKGFLMVGLIVLFAVFGYSSTIFAHRLAAKVSQNFAKNLRQAIFYKVVDLPIEDTNSFSSTSLINRLNTDVSHMQNGLAMTMRIASRAPVLMIGSIISLFIVSRKIALVMIIGLPVALTLLIAIMYFSMKIFQKFQKQNDKLLENVKDSVEGVRMIRAFAQVEHEEGRFNKQNNTLSTIMFKLGKLTSVSSPLTMLLLNILLVIMIYYGALDVNIGNMDQESLLQVINYTTQLTLSLISVMNLILIYTKAYSSATRIKEVLSKENSIKYEGSKEISEGALKIEFKNVSFSYTSNKEYVLKNASFIINEGETFGIVGLTGSGKTTIIDLIMRFFDPQEGKILINDINIKEYSILSLREKIAYAQQKASLLYGDIRTNITMGKDYTDLEIKSALDLAQAKFIKDNEELVLKQGVNFSGGQKQRIALARALIKRSGLMILDDVFSALDYITDYNIRTALDKLEKNMTKIFISQRLSSLFSADKIILIENSRIVAIDSHKNLLEKNVLYKKLYDTQVLGDN